MFFCYYYLYEKDHLGQTSTSIKETCSIWYPRYPAAIAPATAKPSAADFPRPRAASKATVLCSVLSKTESRNVITAFPYLKWKFKCETIKTIRSINHISYPLCSLPDPVYNTFWSKDQQENPDVVVLSNSLGLVLLLKALQSPLITKHKTKDNLSI